MSRNLGSRYCYYCDGDVVHEEKARPILEEEAGVYFSEYRGMSVANAACEDCGAKYLAWVHSSRLDDMGFYREPCEQGHFDLSFRSSFNDEPGQNDLPEYAIDVEVTKKVTKRPWPKCANGHKLTSADRDDCHQCWVERER